MYWDWKGAEAEARRAIEVNPNYAEAYHLLAYILLAQGHSNEALEAEKKSSETDPYARTWALGYELDCLGRYKDAEAELRRRLESNANDSQVRWELAVSLRMQRRDKEAMEQFAETATRTGDPEHAKAIEEAFAKGGERQVQRMELARALENAKKASDKKKYFSPLWLAYAEYSLRLVRLLMEQDLVGLRRRRAVSGIGEAGGGEKVISDGDSSVVISACRSIIVGTDATASR